MTVGNNYQMIDYELDERICKKIRTTKWRPWEKKTETKIGKKGIAC
jgi:hypothetical protein